VSKANVVAAVGLDGTYGFAGSDADAFTAQYAPYAPSTMPTAIS
jgi:hypothetical protein